MKSSFHNYTGARLINGIITFLKRKDLSSIPHIAAGEEKKIYTSEDGNLSISYVCLNENHGYYRIIEINNGRPTMTVTKEFFHF